ncbi:hypothetical protein LTR36_003273 [Oleoguttula mirabilis]|uniref:Abscission/NoCut checkpoint regulator n=1 Tax=Oleoguttula mirabilis TaxID=1507867 RepID=A0AAV9JX66_9PEZI|nr:hypothetical protein LTR36_003273 [Oleoguttula mirabilis]
MSGRDCDLLARLNALKPSSVSLDPTPKASVDVEVNKPQTVEDKLADRLKALRSDVQEPASESRNRSQDADALTAQVRDEVASESDHMLDWQQHDDSEQSLEELLAELGSHDELKLDPDDPKHVASLLKEAEKALPVEHEAEAGKEVASERDLDWVQVDAGEGTEAGEGEVETTDRQDEEAADDYVKRVLAEVEIERKYGMQGGSEGDNDELPARDTAGSTSLELPSTPSTLPRPPGTSRPQTYEDSELEARFSKLGLNLPSTPSAPPSTKPKVTASIGSGKTKSKLPTYTDDDIESWCCICNEDGEVRCLGCDGDIYCQQCWREGHGNGPRQERGHRAVRFVRKDGAGLAAA